MIVIIFHTTFNKVFFLSFQVQFSAIRYQSEWQFFYKANVAKKTCAIILLRFYFYTIINLNHTRTRNKKNILLFDFFQWQCEMPKSLDMFFYFYFFCCSFGNFFLVFSIEKKTWIETKREMCLPQYCYLNWDTSSILLNISKPMEHETLLLSLPHRHYYSFMSIWIETNMLIVSVVNLHMQCTISFSTELAIKYFLIKKYVWRMTQINRY